MIFCARRTDRYIEEVVFNAFSFLQQFMIIFEEIHRELAYSIRSPLSFTRVQCDQVHDKRLDFN